MLTLDMSISLLEVNDIKVLYGHVQDLRPAIAGIFSNIFASIDRDGQRTGAPAAGRV
jgi:hypothetical protein